MERAAIVAALHDMNRAIRHRGPDSSGVWVDPKLPVGLGHVRLSIIDLSEAGNQPMMSAAGDAVIAFNGEVYNFEELREELRSVRGATFRSRTDTEVVLEAYRCWGVDASSRLNGMFAIALVDFRAGKLILVRDRMGIKPLYIASTHSGIVFSSEIKGVIASGLVPPEPDLSRLHEYLYFGNTLGQRTMYRGIVKLPPASWLELDLHTAHIGPTRRYWTAGSIAQSRDDYSTAKGKVRSLLGQAVERQLVSDVPVGVFLSGGVDSSAIVALAARHYRGRLRTYSVGFDYVGDANELPRAREVAGRYGCEHHELQISASNITQVIESVASAHDAPFADPANLPLFQLCAALRGETKVILQGDGGDELWAGYRRYEYLGYGVIGAAVARAAAAALSMGQSMAGPSAVGAMRFFAALGRTDPAERMGLLLTVEGPHTLPARLLKADIAEFVERQDHFCRYREVTANLSSVDDVQAMLLTDLQILLPDIFLEKVDRPTMATSTEVRVPFLDNCLVDYAVSLPARMKVRRGEKKRILRAALRGVVPDSILDGRKVGFGVPVDSWLRGPLRQYAEARIIESPYASDFFDRPRVLSAFAEHADGRRNHGMLLWKYLQLALWLDRLRPKSAGPVERAA